MAKAEKDREEGPQHHTMSRRNMREPPTNTIHGSRMSERFQSSDFSRQIPKNDGTWSSSTSGGRVARMHAAQRKSDERISTSRLRDDDKAFCMVAQRLVDAHQRSRMDPQEALFSLLDNDERRDLVDAFQYRLGRLSTFPVPGEGTKDAIMRQLNIVFGKELMKFDVAHRNDTPTTGGAPATGWSGKPMTPQIVNESRDSKGSFSRMSGRYSEAQPSAFREPSQQPARSFVPVQNGPRLQPGERPMTPGSGSSRREGPSPGSPYSPYRQVQQLPVYASDRAPCMVSPESRRRDEILERTERRYHPRGPYLREARHQGYLEDRPYSESTRRPRSPTTNNVRGPQSPTTCNFRSPQSARSEYDARTPTSILRGEDQRKYTGMSPSSDFPRIQEKTLPLKRYQVGSEHQSKHGQEMKIIFQSSSNEQERQQDCREAEFDSVLPPEDVTSGLCQPKEDAIVVAESQAPYYEIDSVILPMQDNDAPTKSLTPGAAIAYNQKHHATGLSVHGPSGGAHRGNGLRVVQVVAPENLPEGYQFEAQVGNEIFLATVPEGGVAKGQLFDSTMIDVVSKEFLEMDIPHGHWRDGLFSCFAHGLCHPMLLVSCFCPQVALAQIMGRLRLSVMTDRAVSLNSRMRVKTVHFFTMGLVAFNSFSLAFVIKTPHLPLAILVLAMLVVIQVPILFYFVFQVFRTRKRIRKTYHIPETSCEGCEDLLVSVWCTPLALAQMGRHTADYEKYRAFWCSDTGLPNDIEVVLPKV